MGSVVAAYQRLSNAAERMVDLSPDPLSMGGTLRAEVFHLLFAVAPTAILIADDSGRYVEANPAACRVFGHPRDQLVGKSIYDFIDPKDVVPTRDRWDEFRKEKVQSGEFPLVRPDGARRVLRYHAVAEVVPGLHASFLEDITELRDAMRALEQSEARFRILADGLPIILWLGDATGRTQYFNRCWFDYTGMPAEMPGSPDLDRWNDVIHPDDQAHVAPVLRERRAKGENIELTYRLRRRDGTYRWHLARSTAVRDEAGNIVYRLGSATDIEAQEQAIESLRRERDLREKFVAALSHDLRSPLSAVKMAAQLISKRSEDAEVCQTLATRISRNVEHADDLIQNLLDASRITAGEPLAIERVPCDLAALLADVVADQTTIHGDRFIVDAPAHVSVSCDRVAVRRILENLLGNAVKYGAPHTPIRASLIDQSDSIVLSVHNHGRPIEPEDRARIFQSYQRGAPSGNAAPRGWGLGLTLVRGMAEAHGGTATVESSRETGTTFTITLRKA